MIFCFQLMWQYFKLGKLGRGRGKQKNSPVLSGSFMRSGDVDERASHMLHTVPLLLGRRYAPRTPPDAKHSFLARRGTAGAFCRQCRLLMLPLAPQQSNEIVNVICVLEFQDWGCCMGHIQHAGATAINHGILQRNLQNFYLLSTGMTKFWLEKLKNILWYLSTSSVGILTKEQMKVELIKNY